MSKRSNGEGTKITKRGPNNYWQRVTLSDGTRKAFYGTTRREVQEKRDRFMDAYRQGRISTDAAQPVGKYLRDWLRSVRNVKERTREDYERQIGLVLPRLATLRLDQIKPADVQAVYDELTERGLSAVSVAKVHAVLRIAFRRAVKLGYIYRAPTELAEPPRVPEVERPTLSPEQAKAFLEHVRTDRLFALWVIFLMQGLRVGEALGLRWEDIDFPEERMSIAQTVQYVQGKGLVIGTPKTKRSRRVLDLVPVTVTALRAHRVRQLEEQLRAGLEWRAAGPFTNLVFTSVNGDPIHPCVVSQTLHRRLARAGLPQLRAHDLRHTYATLLYEAGCDLIDVQHALGHSSYHLTADTYTHRRPDLRSRTTDHMAQLFSVEEFAV